MKLRVNEAMCSGCRSCEVACALNRFCQLNPKKAALQVSESSETGRYKVNICTLCGICAKECPEEAISKSEKGAYVIDPELCTNCGICVEACPKGVIVSHPRLDMPIICDLCGECIKYCSPKALYDKDKVAKAE